MQILALNCGSSSIKCALIDSGERTLDIRFERIGSAQAYLRIDGESRKAGSIDFSAASLAVLTEAQARLTGDRPAAIVHRIVHGGHKFQNAIHIDAEVLREIDDLSSLAPLHNPPAVVMVRHAREAYPDVAHWAVFDTAFHASMPSWSREYPLPGEVRAKFGVRRFGFHGISHAYVCKSAAAHLRVSPSQLRVISCHLGNGASVAAIDRGQSVDTSMGMTPLEGLVMGTRAGDLDPGILLQLLQSLKLSDIEELLTHRSGLAGLAGTNDMQEIERRGQAGDEDARLAIAIFVHRLRKYIGAYAAVLGGIDVIAFTGGIGEHSTEVRRAALQNLEVLGVALDERKNRDVSLGSDYSCMDIADSRSRVRLLVVRADEELAMAQEVEAAASASTTL